MKPINQWLIIVLFFISISGVAQKKPTKKPAPQKTQVSKPSSKSTVDKKPDTEEDEKKVRDIISFLEYMLNTLGSNSTPVRDKEVLITESYAKIFRDSKVQVEDDLDDERKVITNKDIVAYLKDVNFFFKNVRFEFIIEDITSSKLPDGQYYYKVSTTRNLTGTTAEQKSVNNRQPRYIEINYNSKDKDLKIVSIYTNEFNEKGALTNWWKELSYEWKAVFRKQFNLQDSVALSDLKNIITTTELDVSNNSYVQNIEPLAQLISLKHLNLSRTNITDLTPIRNLTELVELNISETKVKDLTALKYFYKTEKLVINNTAIMDITPISKMESLQELHMKGTLISDFSILTKLSELQVIDLSNTIMSDLSPIEDLVQLKELNLSATAIQDISPLKGLTNIELLELDSTRVKDILPLGSLNNLKVLHASYTNISDLSPLNRHDHLEKVYCDQTLVDRTSADAFMTKNQHVLIILDSKDLKQWWDALPGEWQKVFSSTAKIGAAPSREEMAKIPLLDSININGLSRISNLEPLRKLQRLKVIIASKTTISDLSPINGQKEIEYLDISETNVSDLSAINQFHKLKKLKANGIKIVNSERILAPSLQILYADQSGIDDHLARQFLKENRNCLIIYKTEKLNEWWSNLSESWKGVFTDQMGKKEKVSTEDLHRLVEQEALHFKEAQVSDLSALTEFVRLNELHFSGTAISSFSPIQTIKSLKSLHATSSPIQKLDSLDLLTDLEDLDISNTPIDDIYLIWKLKKLKKLNCSGTQIKRLDALEKLETLELLDCSNTFVSKLDPLDYLPLKLLKCYNTKVSSRAIDRFKASHPDCSVVYYR